MAYLERHTVTVTTAADGTATAYTDLKCNGFVHSIRYVKTDFATGVDFTITAEKSGATLWAQNNVDATVTVFPREATAGTDGAAALYAAAGTAVRALIPVANERIQIVIAQGGNAKVGTFHFYVGG